MLAWKLGVKLQGVEELFYYAGVQVCSARAVVTEGGVWMWEVEVYENKGKRY